MGDDVEGVLFSAWCEEAVKHDVLPQEPHTLIYLQDEFEKVVAGISHLEAAAHRAAVHVSTKRGRPKGTAILPADFIETLAMIYQDSTRLESGGGDGPFARFVFQFLISLGRRNIEYESVVGCVKGANHRARTTTPTDPKGIGGPG